MPTCRSRGLLALPPLLLAWALPGCDRLGSVIEQKAQEVAEDMAPEAEVSPLPGPTVTADEQLAAKLSLYLECTGRASERIRQSWQRYDERVAEDGTPRKKGVTPFLYKIDSELLPCEQAVTRGPTTAPPLPWIEAAMARYLEHARAFAEATVALDTYYEQQGYEEDAWAKGKALAPGFRASFEAWDEADTELRALVDARKDEVDRAVLALVEQRQGKGIEWHSRRYVLAARAFVRCAAPIGGEAGEGAGEGAGKTSRGEADDCTEAFTALQEAEADFRQYYDANRTKADAVFWMSAFEGSVADSFTAAKDVERMLGKGKVPADALATLVREHDGLVSDANNLRFP